MPHQQLLIVQKNNTKNKNTLYANRLATKYINIQ